VCERRFVRLSRVHASRRGVLHAQDRAGRATKEHAATARELAALSPPPGPALRSSPVPGLWLVVALSFGSSDRRGHRLPRLPGKDSLGLARAVICGCVLRVALVVLVDYRSKKKPDVEAGGSILFVRHRRGRRTHRSWDEANELSLDCALPLSCTLCSVQLFESEPWPRIRLLAEVPLFHSSCKSTRDDDRNNDSTATTTADAPDRCRRQPGR